MRAVIQRSRNATVTVDGAIVGAIDRGLVILVGVGHDDTPETAVALARKIAALRIFPDAHGVMNLSLLDTGYEALVVSQFTLMADTRKGNRPSYGAAVSAEKAQTLYEFFVARLRETIGDARVETGLFRAMMDVALVNEGPVTIVMETG